MAALWLTHSQLRGILEAVPASVTRSWTVPGIPGLECFRAIGLVHEYPRHSHATWSIGVVDDGAGGIWYRGANQRGGPGELIAINPGETHTGYPLQRAGISYSMLYVGDELVKEVLPELKEPPCFPGVAIRDAGLGRRLRQLCRRLELAECCASALAPALGIETELYSALVCLFVRHARANVPPPVGRERGHVAVMKEYLRANFRRNVRLSELAGHTGLSKGYLIRAFHRVVGMPPHQWLLQWRIERSRKPLQEGRPISEIANELGFADQSHFHRRFKKVTAMTPSAYVQGHFRSRRVDAARK